MSGRGGASQYGFVWYEVLIRRYYHLPGNGIAVVGNHCLAYCGGKATLECYVSNIAVDAAKDRKIR